MTQFQQWMSRTLTQYVVTTPAQVMNVTISDRQFLSDDKVSVRKICLLRGVCNDIFWSITKKNFVCPCHASNQMWWHVWRKKCLVGKSKITLKRRRRNSTMICLLRYLWSDFLLRYQGRLALSKSKLRSFFKNFPFSILTFDPVLSHRITQEEGIVHHGW